MRKSDLLFKQNVFFLYVQVERMKSASAHSISQHIRQVIYGILFSVDGISSDSGKRFHPKTRKKELENLCLEV